MSFEKPIHNMSTYLSNITNTTWRHQPSYLHSRANPETLSMEQKYDVEEQCEFQTNYGEQCPNLWSLSSKTEEKCNRYCSEHSDKWLDSLLTNPYVVVDKNGKEYSCDLGYDITLSIPKEELSKYFDMSGIDISRMDEMISLKFYIILLK